MGRVFNGGAYSKKYGTYSKFNLGRRSTQDWQTGFSLSKKGPMDNFLMITHPKTYYCAHLRLTFML